MRRWSLSDVALARPVMVGMLLVAIVLLGVIATFKLPLSFLPTSEGARAYVRVHITRVSPEVLEREVIRPLEENVAGMRGLRRIQVGSGSWGLRMNLEFDPGSDVDARKLELRDRLDRVRPDLPTYVQRLEIGTYKMMDDPMMHVRISSDADLAKHYYIIQERIIRPIERISGVARVELEGVEPHELEVALDIEAVTRSGVSFTDLGSTVRGAPRGRSLGLLRQSDEDAGMRSPGSPADAKRYAQLPLARGREIAEANGGPAGRGFARLGEVADVTIHPEEADGGRRLNGRPAISLEVYGSAGASTVDVTRRVRAAVNQMANDPTLGRVEVAISRDQGEIILDTLGDLRNTGIWGGLLGLLVLFGFLHRFRTTLSAAVSIPLSVLAACAVLFLRGDELNCIVLLGLVLGVGMLIDNAVVIVESIEVQSRKGLSPLQAARKGAREVGLATIASTLSSVIVFIPLLFGDPADRMTAYLRPLGITFAIGLIASLIVSQTSVPLLMGHLLKPKKLRPVRHPILDGLRNVYGWLIARTLRYRRLTIAFGLALAASAAYPATTANFKFGDVDWKPDHLPIKLQLAGSKGHERVEEHLVVMEEAILAQRDELGIESLVCSFRHWGGNCKVYQLEPAESEAEMEAFEERVEAVLPEQVGVTYRLGESDYDWRENRDRKVVEFALKGEDMGVLMQLAKGVTLHLQGTLAKGDPDNPDAGGYDTVISPFTEGSREIYVQLDEDRLSRQGLGSNEVADRVAMAFQGVPLGRARGEHGEVSLRLSSRGGVEGEAADIDRLRDLRIIGPGGEEIPLSSVATFETLRTPWWIQRVDRATEVRIRVRFFSTDMKGNFQLVSDALSSFQFPPGYSWGQGTRWKHRRQANQEMLINLALCLILVYAVMASLFESFLQPFAILATCLLGCFGAPWAMWLTGTTIDSAGIIGLFILIGIVVNNGIMLIDKVTQLRRAGVPRDEALQQAGRQRLRPILMTASTTILGLVPMLIHHPTLAGVYYHGIAFIIAGGLATSTVITLVFLPAAYSLLEDLASAARAKWRIVHRE